MKILVTWGTVFVSKYTAQYFAQKGHEVFVLNRGTRPQVPGVNLLKAYRHAGCGRLYALNYPAAAINVP